MPKAQVLSFSTELHDEQANDIWAHQADHRDIVATLPVHLPCSTSSSSVAFRNRNSSSLVSCQRLSILLHEGPSLHNFFEMLPGLQFCCIAIGTSCGGLTTTSTSRLMEVFKAVTTSRL